MASSKPTANMLWGGRFTSGLDPLMITYNESIHFDRRIYAQDIRGSIAYARANTQLDIPISHRTPFLMSLSSSTSLTCTIWASTLNFVWRNEALRQCDWTSFADSLEHVIVPLK